MKFTTKIVLTLSALILASCGQTPPDCGTTTALVGNGDSPVGLLELFNIQNATIKSSQGKLLFVRDAGGAMSHAGLTVGDTVTIKSCEL